MDQSPWSHEHVDFFFQCWWFDPLKYKCYDRMTTYYDVLSPMHIVVRWLHTMFEEVLVNSSQVTFDTMRCSLHGQMIVTGVDISSY